jgi:hypothetical protein
MQNVVILKKTDLRQVFICLMLPPLQNFCLGWSSNFEGSESEQIQSLKLLQNYIQQNPKPTPLLNVFIYNYTYSILIHTVKWGSVGGRES